MRHSSILFAGTMPRAITGGRIRADANAEALRLIQEIGGAQRERFAEFESALNAQGAALAALGLNGASGAGISRPDDPTYTTTFASYFRHGSDEGVLKAANATGQRQQIKAALQSGSPADGGYLAPTEWDRNINKALVPLSPMRRLSQVRTTTVGAYSTLWTEPGFGTGWVGETAARPATSTPQFTPLTFASGEIYANPAITQTLLDDAQFDVEGWLVDSVDTEFAKQENIAFILGDGVNKPYGLLTYAPGMANAARHPGGALTVIASGNAATMGTSADIFVDMAYKLPAPYRQNATWMMNSQTAAIIAKMKDGQGNFIWRESLLVGQPATLLGRPVELNEDMPNVGAAVDGKAMLPIAFGDFRSGYVVNDRNGSRLLRDPYTNKPYVSFYMTRRVGGGLLDPKAIVLLKIAAN